MTRRKYKQGEQIRSISEFDQVYQDGNHYFIWNGKTVHISILMSLQYRTLYKHILNGMIYKAERIEDDRKID